MSCCPQCKCENTQRLEMIFNSGTVTSVSQSRTSGVVVGDMGINSTGSKTTTVGKSMSNLAALAAPPAALSFKYPIIIIIVGLLFCPGLFQYNTPALAYVFVLGLFAVGGYWGYSRFSYNSKILPGLLDEWRKKWMCHKCGTVYTA